MKRRSSRQAGFSFTEIVIVMGVVALLVAVGLTLVSMAARQSRERETRALLVRVRSAIQTHELDRGAFPRDRVADVGRDVPPVTPPNETNGGVEAVVLSARLLGEPGAVMMDRSDFGNADGDRLARPYRGVDATLLEFRDAWGRPLVYVDARSYGRLADRPGQYVADDGRIHDVRPWRTDEGMFAEPASYQLFSVGADGVPNTDDDLKAWELSS